MEVAVVAVGAASAGGAGSAGPEALNADAWSSQVSLGPASGQEKDALGARHTNAVDEPHLKRNAHGPQRSLGLVGIPRQSRGPCPPQTFGAATSPGIEPESIVSDDAASRGASD